MSKSKKDRVPFKTKFVETEINAGFAKWLTVFIIVSKYLLFPYFLFLFLK